MAVLAQKPPPYYEADEPEDPCQERFPHGGANDATTPPFAAWMHGKGSSPYRQRLFRLVNHVRACVLLEHMGKPRDDKDAAQNLARALTDIAGQLASLKGEANAWLSDPNYGALKQRLESAHSALEAAAVEARRGVRLNDDR